MLKIIGGEYRSRQLQSPGDGRTTRPYLARIRESVFSLLRGWIEDANVLDLFAGVGTVGLEAASRGAASVLMVERDKKIYRLLRENIERLGCGDRAIPMLGDALAPTCLLRAPRPVQIVFIDPPFETMRSDAMRQRVLDQMAGCRSIMGDEGFLVLRSPLGAGETGMEVPGFDGPETHDYGKENMVLLYSPAKGGRSDSSTDRLQSDV